MVDEQTNPVAENAGATPDAGATTGQENLPELTSEQKKGMSTEQINYYENARKMVAASTQRYQEASAIRKQADEQLQQIKDEKSYYEQRYAELMDKQNQLLDRLASPTVKSLENETPGVSILADPEKFARATMEELAAVKKDLAAAKDQIALIPAKLEFEKVVDKLLAGAKYAKRDDLNRYFEAKGAKYPVNEQTMALAVKEIDMSETRRLDDLIKTRQAELDAATKLATSQVAGAGAPAVEMPEVRKFHDLNAFAQEEAIREMLRKGQL